MHPLNMSTNVEGRENEKGKKKRESKGRITKVHRET